MIWSSRFNKRGQTAKDIYLKECSGNSVYYDSSKHLAIIFQTFGSVWQKVLPFCILNATLTCVVLYLLDLKHPIDLTFSDKGHSYMNLMVSFLIVTRASITYGRFMEARQHLSTILNASRSLIQTISVLTQYENGQKAIDWRNRVALRTIFLLRVTCGSLEYQSSKKHAWEVPELALDKQKEIRKKLIMIEDECSNGDGAHKWAHGKRSLMDENFRVPPFAAYTLKSTIISNRANLTDPLPAPLEVRLLGYVDEYLVAFTGLQKLITTPFPFPLVQMARTFLFVWVFSLPFVLAKSIEKIFDLLIVIFIMTYGFVGLEYVSIELDDPFGDDPNDFDDLKMVQMIFEDIYVIINEINGEESANMLRQTARHRDEKTASPMKLVENLGSEVKETTPLLDP